jgi:hypothetical protein
MFVQTTHTEIQVFSSSATGEPTHMRVLLDETKWQADRKQLFLLHSYPSLCSSKTRSSVNLPCRALVLSAKSSGCDQFPDGLYSTPLPPHREAERIFAKLILPRDSAESMYLLEENLLAWASLRLDMVAIFFFFSTPKSWYCERYP